MKATQGELLQRDEILVRILEAVRDGLTIKLPTFDSASSRASESALLSIVNEPNPFCGNVGDFFYQFEGEEDLLHLFVVRKDQGEISMEDAQTVASFTLPNVPPSFFFVKPGVISQHFFIGHDFLFEYCKF